MPTAYIPSGHGVNPRGKLEPGTINPKTGLKEFAVALEVVKSVDDPLITRGADVIVEHRKWNPNYLGSARFANDNNVDVVNSIHFDWYKNEDPGGFFLYTSKAGRDLAEAQMERWRKEGLPLHKRPLQKRDDLHLLNATYAPAVIVEISPIDRIADNAAKGRACGEGVADFLGLPQKIKPLEEEDVFVDAAIAAVVQDPKDRVYIANLIKQTGHSYGSVIDVMDVIQALRKASK